MKIQKASDGEIIENDEGCLDITWKGTEDLTWRARLTPEDSGTWDLLVESVDVRHWGQRNKYSGYFRGSANSRREALDYVKQFKRTEEVPDEFFFTQASYRYTPNGGWFTRADGTIEDGRVVWTVSILEPDYEGPQHILEKRDVPFDELGLWLMRAEEEVRRCS